MYDVSMRQPQTASLMATPSQCALRSRTRSASPSFSRPSLRRRSCENSATFAKFGGGMHGNLGQVDCGMLAHGLKPSVA